MSSRYRGFIRCPLCSKYVSVKSNGKMYRHGPKFSCPGATEYTMQSIDSPRAREVVSELRRLWRIGDALAASVLTGVPYPAPVIPADLCTDGELAFIVTDARTFITEVAQRIGVADAIQTVAT